MRTFRLTSTLALATAAAVAAFGSHAVRADAPAGPAGPAAVVPSAASVAAERVLRAVATAPLTITRDGGGLAHAVGTSGGQPLPLPAGVPAGAEAEKQARAHLARAAALFGLRDTSSELRLVPDHRALDAIADPTRPGAGDRILRFQQLRNGVPVLGGELVVVLDAVGALRSITGETVASPAGSPDKSGRVEVSAAEAKRTALTAVKREHPTSKDALRVEKAGRWYLEPEVIGVPVQRHISSDHVWQIEVSDRAAVREMVLVDADTGTIPLRWNLIHTATNQAICDNNNVASRPIGDDCDGPYARPGTSDVDKATANTTRVANFFAAKLGVNLTSLLGRAVNREAKRLRSTVRFCASDNLCAENQGVLFDNAFWNGRGMYYGAQWPEALDVVGHELAHGVTERTSNLLYLYQSGAINESMSDIFGELTELSAFPNADRDPGYYAPWSIAEDAPIGGGAFALRNMSNPPTYYEPDRMTSSYFTSDPFFADNGGVHTNSGVGNKTAFLIADGGSFNGQRITRLGRDSTARLYYRALRMLTSGSDYADLSVVLRQACGALFSAGTCAQVGKAVAATQMAAQPRGAAAAPEASQCPAGTRKTRIFADGFENFSRRTWTLENYWGHIRDYARSGRGSIYGVEPDVARSSSAVLNRRIRVPRGDADTFLRFAHQYRLEHSLLDNGLLRRAYDGAVLEYRVGNGGWTSTANRSWQHGPNRTIQPDGGRAYRGFGGDSRGYTSSRVGLKTLAGKQVQFRWRVIGDKSVAEDGWTIDDVDFFICGKKKPTDVERLTLTRKKTTIKVSWTPPAYRGASGLSKYKVSVKGPGVKGSVNVKASKKSVTLKKIKKKKFQPGKKYKVTIQPIAKSGAGPTTTASVKLRKAKKKRR